MVTTYLSIFYDERYNCVLGDLPAGHRLYDPYMTIFINKHNLLNRKNDLQTIILTEQIEDKYQVLNMKKVSIDLSKDKTFLEFVSFRFPDILDPHIMNPRFIVGKIIELMWLISLMDIMKILIF